ncbi:MAG: hypothetical protein GY847_14685 [Proteobacteria bacterium]|nr:hypothetical protein [Pseudomonadota bacterium]
MMHCLRKTVHGAAVRVALLSVMLANTFLIGCPSLRVAQISLKPNSIAPSRFTLQAHVEVVEEEPTVDDDGKLAGGRGVLGIWLPFKWAATAVRLSGPGDTAYVELAAITDAEGHFPPPFPYTPGSWFAFVSGCNNIGKGTWIYDVEIDIQGDTSEISITLGVAAALFNEEGSNGPVPTEVQVDLANGTAKVRQPPAAPSTTGLRSCKSIEREQCSDNTEGCSCSYPGSRCRGMVNMSIRFFNSSILHLLSSLI